MTHDPYVGVKIFQIHEPLLCQRVLFDVNKYTNNSSGDNNSCDVLVVDDSSHHHSKTIKFLRQRYIKYWSV